MLLIRFLSTDLLSIHLTSGLFIFVDKDDSGTISYDEFLVGIRVSYFPT